MNDLTLNTKNKTYLFLQTNNNQYMMDSEHVSKIIVLQNLDCPKMLPKHVIGLLEFEGDFINVLDLRSLLGLEIEPYPLNSKIIILDYNDMKFALVAEQVSDIRRIKSSLIKEAPYDNSKIIQQIYSPKNDLSTMIINIDGIYEVLKDTLQKNVFEENKINPLPNNQNDIEILKQRSLVTKQKEEIKIHVPISSDNQYTTFRIENSRYCLKNTHIKEFFKINKTKITHVPSTPDYIKGIINIKGDFICVFDVQKYFDRGETIADDKSNIIVLNDARVKLGILTNGISKNMNFDNIEFNAKDCIDFVQDEKIYCILNIESILDNLQHLMTA